MKLFATVKNIKINTEKEDKNWRDGFYDGEMESMIGKEYEFEPCHVNGFAPSWYVDTTNRWCFHVSWLEKWRISR